MHLRWLIPGLLTFALPSVAAADEFAAGSLIIPMDTDYQDLGMLRAYGLVYELLRQGVPVRWMIKSGKAKGGVDFTASGTDVMSGAAVDGHGYRGGPWVVDAADADVAMPIVEAWQADSPEVAVHEASANAVHLAGLPPHSWIKEARGGRGTRIGCLRAEGRGRGFFA